MPRVSVNQIAREIELKIRRDEDQRTHRETRSFAEKVKEHWKLEWIEAGPHPYETLEYLESIHVERSRAQKGISSYSVVSDSPNANLIEYGTGPDKPGSKSPYGPNTPTPEFAPAAKTAHHFGGTQP